MTKDELLELIRCGREIEFCYDGDMYSITQGMLDGKEVISFCKFYGETTEVELPEDVLIISRKGIFVWDMIHSISDNDIWIY